MDRSLAEPMTREPASSWVSAWLGLTAFLFAANLAGPLTPAFGQLILALALAGAVLPSARGVGPRWERRALLATPLLPLVLSALAGDGGQTLRLLGTVAALAAAAAVARHGRQEALATATARAVAVAALAWLALRHLPWVWLGFEAAAEAISRLASMISGQPLRLGPTFAGVWVALLALAFTPLGAGRTPVDRLRRGLYLAGALSAILVAHAALLPLLERAAEALVAALLAAPVAHRQFHADPGVVASLAAPLPLAVALLAIRSLVPFRPAAAPAGALSPRLAAAGALLALAGGWALATQPEPPARPARIAFHDRGLIDWVKPVRGRYGLAQLGMFGVLRDYLEAAGHSTSTLSGGLAPARLAAVDVLAIVNPRQALSKSEHAAVWGFVENGGGLLVLGDHTDLSGTREPLNRLLAPVGVGFEFDSAFALRRHWRFCQELRPHPVTSGLRDQGDTRIGTGASLALAAGPSRPLILGRYGFGDLGNRANTGFGAFLGDYRYQRGERLGDVVLAAAAEVGRGRVVAFGDTSSFQTLSLPFSYPLIDRTVRYLAAGDAGGRWLAWFGALALVAGLLGLGRGRAPLSAFALLLLAAAGAHEIGRPPEPAPLPGARVALLDTALVPDVPLQFFDKGSIGGVVAALYRAGYLPLARREAAPRSLETASLAAFVDPARRPLPEEVAAVERLLARGGTLLVAAGAETAAGNDLLAPCGLAVVNRPLGPARIAEGTSALRFVDARAVIATGERPLATWAQWRGEVIVAETAVGPGRCLAIADPRFVADENLEGESRFEPGNVALFENLLAARRSS